MQKSGDSDFSSSLPFSPNIQKISIVCQAVIWYHISVSISRFLCLCSYLPIYLLVIVVQLLSHVWLFVIPWAAAYQASLFFTISCSLPKLGSIESVMSSDHLLLCCPLLLLSSIFPSIKVFSSESTLHIRWPKYWGSIISLSNDYSGLISFRIVWFDFLAVQGTLKNLL